MAQNNEQIVQRLKERIQQIDWEFNDLDTGTVLTVGDGIALARGLRGVQANELVRFEDGTMGLALNLEENQVGIILLGNDRNIRENDTVYRTEEIASVPVGDDLLGRVVDPLGNPVDGKGEIKATEEREVERPAPGVMTRKSVHQPLHTGVKIVDAMIPIGKGQRELIIGDRQTGKTSIALNAILNQKGQNVKCVYVAIGQKASTVVEIVETLKRYGADEYTVVVNSPADNPSALQYLAPYSGTAMGEYWMDNGEDVLVVYDDLSKHAVAYRTISLLLKRPSGREAYPGDVFYIHSRLLERAAKLSDEKGGGSLTALPFIETQAGDISAYVPTNVISITDGQIFLQSNLFNSGVRPAVDAGLSVSRVGGSAQIKAMKKVAGTLRLDLASYRELEAFSQFGSDLDKATQDRLNRGARTVEVLKQGLNQPLAVEKQVFILYALTRGFIDDIEVADVLRFESELFTYLEHNHKDLLDHIKTKGTLADEEAMNKAINDFKKTFNV